MLTPEESEAVSRGCLTSKTLKIPIGMFAKKRSSLPLDDNTNDFVLLNRETINQWPTIRLERIKQNIDCQKERITKAQERRE
jgi:hypothetical protein